MSSEENGIRLKAIENPLDISFIAAIDYVCNLCHLQVKKGKSHAHINTTLSKAELARRALIAKNQKERRQRRIWSKRTDK